MKNLLVISFIVVVNLCSAQSYELFRQDKSYFIDHSSLIELRVSENYDEEENCCTAVSLRGTLEGAKADSVLLNVQHLWIAKDLTKPAKFRNVNYLDWETNKWIAKNDIEYLYNYKTEKVEKRRRLLAGTGAFFAIGSLVTGINALFLPEESRNKMLVISGVQLVGGLVLGVSFDFKEFRFKGEQQNWKFK